MKHLLVLTTAVLTFGLAPPASAGDYNVQACFDSGGVAGNGAWTHYSSSGHVAAYSHCPGEGIVTRITGGPERAPKWATADSTFTAPPGTRITRLWGDFRINTGQGWYAGFVDDTDTWLWCSSSCSTWGTFQPINIWLDSSHVRAHVVCGAEGGCPRNALYGDLAMKNVTVTLNDPTPPTVAITGGSVTKFGWNTGDQTVEVAATDSTGIRRVIADIANQDQPRGLIGNCSAASPRPCTDVAGVVKFPAAAFGTDGRKTLVIRALDGGDNWSEIRHDLWIDRNPPGQALDARIEGGDGWRSRNSYAISWRNPVQTAAPIAAMRYLLCPATNVGGDARNCVDGTVRKRDVSSAPELRVPRPGEWQLRMWLEDEAGNADRERAVPVGVLRLDDDAPTVKLVPQDNDDPTRVRALAGDATSGIASGQIEARRDGEDSWRVLPSTLDGTGLSATIDDGRLPRGRYKLRASVVDRAGNERSTQTDTGGAQVTRLLPLRVGTRIVVGAPKRIRARNSKGKWRTRTVLRVNPRAGYGRTIALRGRLTMPGANPLAGADLEVWERVKLPGAEWRRVSVIRTDHTGTFRYKALRGPSRTLRFHYPGTAKIRSRSTQVDLGVRAMTSFHVSRNRVVNGEEVRFRGRLKGRPAGEVGKLLHVQVFTRGRWSTFATPRANRETGRWSLPYRFSATRGLVRYRFRVLIPRETSFPYETGRSPSRTVLVRGL
jgi:hypothetical protein